MQWIESQRLAVQLLHECSPVDNWAAQKTTKMQKLHNEKPQTPTWPCTRLQTEFLDVQLDVCLQALTPCLHNHSSQASRVDKRMMQDIQRFYNHN